MKLLKDLKGNLLAGLIIVVLASLISCQSGGSQNNSSMANSSKSMAICTLYVKSNDFLGKFLQKNGQDSSKLVFQFLVKDSDSLTLVAWRGPHLLTDTFDRRQTLVFSIGKQNITDFQNKNFYFGNLVFHKKQLKNLDSLLNQNQTYKFLLFIPKLGPQGHIYYTIALAKDLNGIINNDIVNQPLTTSLNLNPSPPKNYME